MKNDTLGEGYLHAEEFLVDGKWCEFRLTIAKVIPPGTIKAADDTLIDKPILEFEKTTKRLVLNRTNGRLVRYATGTGQTAKWVGKTVCLYPALGDWFGQKNVVAVRVRIPGTARPFMKAANLGKDITGRIHITAEATQE